MAFFESVPLPTSSSSDAPHPSSELVLERVLVDELGSATDDAQIDNIVDKITPTWWPSTDPATDEVWDEFVRNEIKLVASGEVSALVKPSGTLAAPLMILWHYPSMATTHQAFGVTADDSNPCLRMQFKKFREQSVSNMLTIDSVLRRFDLGLHRRVKVPGEPYDNETEEWKTLNKSLIKWLLDHSAAKVVLLLGKRNVESVTDIFPTAISI